MEDKKENMTIRIDVKFKKELMKEAAREDRNLSSYVIHLLKVHPNRQQTQEKKK